MVAVGLDYGGRKVQQRAITINVMVLAAYRNFTCNECFTIVMANYSCHTITYHIDMCVREVFQCFEADFKGSRK